MDDEPTPGSSLQRIVGRQLKALTATDVAVAEVLASIQPVRNISYLGHALIDRAVMKGKGNHQSAQGLALLAGRWLKRLERAGCARVAVDGWVLVAPNAAVSLHAEVPSVGGMAT